ncbi:MAG: hypothetical protein KJO85_10890, partial [Gammaproteobacteria bacterium]|nr:hypothetical protein [Gammaproteobacteria bacterium]
MKAVSLDSGHAIKPVKPGLLDSVARKIVFRHLVSLEHGELVLLDGNERHVFGKVDSDEDLRATITVTDPRFFGEIAYGGSIGTGESWMERYWECDDLLQLVQLM